MASSPYTPAEVKQYMRKNNLQEMINTTVNDLLRAKPDDPYGYMIGCLQKKASSDIKILGINALQTITTEGFPAIKVFLKIQYMNQIQNFLIKEPFGILSDQNMLFDGDEQRYSGKGMNKGIDLINQKLTNKIIGYKCTQQTDVDKMLEAFYKQNGFNGLYQINTLSYVLPKIQSHILSKPLHEIIGNIIEKPKNQKQLHIPLMVNCLHGGKVLGSKCKVTKFMILTKQIKYDPFIAQNVLQTIRKSIVSGKAGQAALKISPDGTFICPLDTINDNLKIVEDAINNTAEAKQIFNIGLSWAADTLFSQDTKKYELQNPKTPFDNDQMIDYLVKLVTEKPVIKYLQDPLASSQKGAYVKLKSKLQENEVTKDVKIGSRINNIIKISEQNISQQIKKQFEQLSQVLTNDSHPDLSNQELQQKNAHKFQLDFLQIRLFQLRTLSEVITLANSLKKFKTSLILQDNLYETDDTSLIDVSLALDAISCIGSLNGNKYDRICKLNRIRQIINMPNFQSSN